MYIQDAVRDGELGKVIEIINSVGISHTDGYSLVYEALENKHTEIAKLLLSYITEFNNNSKICTDTLHFTVKNGYIDIVQILLDKGARVDAESEHGRTSLHIAIECGKMDIIELLLNRLANINAQDNNGATPLSIAAENGYLEVVKQLLIRGAYVDTAFSYYFKESYTLYKLSGVTPLHIAVQNEHFQIVEYLLKHEAHINSVITSVFKKHYTPLHLAIETNNEEIIKLLIKYGANIHAEGKDSITPLHIAAQKGNNKAVEFLLENGANIDAQDTEGKTVLSFAVQKGCYVVVEAILKCFPDIDNKSNQSSLIAAVCGCGKEYKNIAESLLKYGFTIIPEEVNFELLQASVEKGYLKILEDSLNYNPCIIKHYNLKYKGSTLLHTAAKNKQEQIANLLINHGADVDACDEIGKPPIFYATANMDFKMIDLLVSSGVNVKDNPEILNMAVRKGCTNIVEILLQRDVDINAVDKYGRTALHFTALNDKEGESALVDKNLNASTVKARIAELVLSRGAKIDAGAKNGLTTLHSAAEIGNVELVCMLLKYNANVDVIDVNGMTPLHFSVEGGYELICEMLLKKGANVNAKQEKGETALHIATQKGHKEVVKLLLKYGALIGSKDKTKNTPLHISAVKAQLEILEILLNFGDVDCTDGTGKTPLHVACGEKNEETVTTLLEYGCDINITDENNNTPLNSAMVAINPPQYKFYIVNSEAGYNIHIGTTVRTGKEIIDVLKKHIIKMNIANLYVSENNLQAISMNSELSDFEIDCEKEMELLPSEMISYNISFHNILTRDINQLAIFARNEDVVQVLKSDHCKIKFPIYSSLIISHIRKGVVRKKLLDDAIKQFYALFKSFPELPYDCMEKVLCYFSDKELRILTGACEKFSDNKCLNTDVKDVPTTSGKSTHVPKRYVKNYVRGFVL